MTRLAIIGGSGLTRIPDLKILRRRVVHTPYGEPSAPLVYGAIGDGEVVFLPRHGSGHTIPPHRINYRANIWALSHIGVETVVGVAAVGGIARDLSPLDLVIPDQILDYTYGRDHTFFEEEFSPINHVDFTEPYCADLRRRLLAAAEASGNRAHDGGTYAAMQGPRLETRAEIDRLERDGAHIVGMTGMPEAALAREEALCYACCALVVNPAAGRGPGEIRLRDMEQCLEQGMERVRQVLGRLVAAQATGIG